MSASLETKKIMVLTHLKSLGSLAVAFSGGVDSTLLLALAKEALGRRVVALTARSSLHPPMEFETAKKLAQELEVTLVEFDSREMSDDKFIANSPDRCFVCKMALFEDLKKQAARMGIERIAHGANADDRNDYRPGMEAATRMGIIAPLLEANLSKSEIRAMARQMRLSNWDLPAMSCLATRIPYGSPITKAKLSMVEDAENVLRKNGFEHCRVRHHGDVARIEVPQESLERFVGLPQRPDLVESIKKLGFQHVALDLEGYCSGSMNRVLRKRSQDAASASFPGN